jgi:hypothetical protein
MGTEAALIAVMKEAGPLAALIGFFVWRDYKREQSLGKVIRELQDFQRDTLVKLLERTTEAIIACTKAMEKCIK